MTRHRQHEEEEWEHLTPDVGKEAKRGRKIASATDRSKYKKTDQVKLKKQQQEQGLAKIAGKTLRRGRILSISPQAVTVDSEGVEFSCSMRGALKQEITRMKNLITVGDFVSFEAGVGQEGAIAHVEERRSMLARMDHFSKRKQQLIAANIDQVLITLSVLSPALKPFLADRYIIAALKGNMTPILVINKIDFLKLPPGGIDKETLYQERLLYEEFCETYAALDIPLFPVSCRTGQGLDELKEVMQGKASVFSGQSGVGKSSLINVVTGLDLRTGDIRENVHKGAHTTSSAQLIPLSFGGWCIDTPGIRSFGMWDMQPEEVVKYFPEIDALGHECHFPNCTHTHEPECAVLKALEKEEIGKLRYLSYQKLLEDLEGQRKLIFD